MKSYFIDTNILIDNPDAVQLLSDNGQNKILLSYNILNELDKLKRDPKLNHTVAQVVKNLKENYDYYSVIGTYSDSDSSTRVDDKILLDILAQCNIDIILVTNDNILQLKARSLNIKCENFKRSLPFYDIENGDYTGIHEKLTDKIKTIYTNFFYWENGDFYFYQNEDYDSKLLNEFHCVWKVYPKNHYQNAMFELGLNDNIDLITIQGAAGTGKTFLSLALAFHYIFHKKTLKKIYVTKAMYEIGQKLGYLPGDILEKVSPYMKYLESLIGKLNDLQQCSKLYNPEGNKTIFNEKKFEILPINFIRGMDIEDAFIIIDEAQNLSRLEIKTLLSRMGENVKCLCVGDTSQIDNPYLNNHNNGLNWVIKKCRGERNYAHLSIKSEKYRGPICELVVKTGL